MHSAHDNFEAFLRSGLKAAAAGAPQAPSVFVIRQRLRRRSVVRGAWASVAAALFVAAVLVLPGVLTPAANVQTARGGSKFVPSLPGPNVENLPGPQPPAEEGHPVTPPVQPTPGPQNTLVAALAPLTDDADLFALRKSLADYFAAHGIQRAEIRKEPGEEIDYVLRADGVVDFAQVTVDIQSLLANYARASVTLKDNDITCWLLARALREN